MRNYFCSWLLAGSLLYSTAVAQRVCYFPDGKTIAKQDTPCVGDDTEGACCGQGSACLSNGLCKHTDHTPSEGTFYPYGRGSCTDKTWTSKNCPSVCITEENGDNIMGGAGVGRCDAFPSRDRYFCFNNQTTNQDEDCSEAAISNKVAFEFAEVANPATMTIIGVTETAPPTLSSAPAAGATSDPSNASNTPLPTPPAKDYSVAIGAGVGVPLGILAIGIIGYLFYRHHRRASQNRAPAYDQPFSQEYSAGNPFREVKYASHQSEPAQLHADSSPVELYSHEHEHAQAGFSER